jgi:hypothetical protein
LVSIKAEPTIWLIVLYKLKLFINNYLQIKLRKGHMANKEFFSINGESLLKKVKELIAEGNVTRITIADKAGKEIASFPLTLGLVGVVLLPMFAAVGALAALVGECTIIVERHDTDEPKTEDITNQDPS